MTLLILLVLSVAVPLGWRIAPALNRTVRARWIRARFDPVAHGLPPREALDARRAGPQLPVHRAKEIEAIAHDALQGDWRSAAAFVAAAGEDWDERWARIELLQEIAAHRDAWLEDWLRARPDSCTATTVQAQLLLHRAWEARGDGSGQSVPANRMARFLVLAKAALETAQQAAPLAPEDPGPWVVMVTAARALRHGHEEFVPLWDQLVLRAPHHYLGHRQALEYWCAKWAGSHRLMMAFAEDAVRRAPAGSPLAGIYLDALNELAQRAGRSALPSSAAARELLAQVARSLGQAREGDRQLPRLRHLLASFLLQAGSHDAALEQFRLIGPWCGAEPWTRERDPAAAFDLARGRAATRASRT
ncbi:hypothetical protein OG500_35720 [Kitasatospora sp. NBC_01250]|uniref:hypothetical protein n=1 Tax=Kitasatospora sp. NBC_01250 TaxID=2903571 RepID=UPI002E304338|nr:hypothetical protein [Kitasatospora sp. NBC_01250]